MENFPAQMPGKWLHDWVRANREDPSACREWLSSPIQKSTTRRQQSVRIAKREAFNRG